MPTAMTCMCCGQGRTACCGPMVQQQQQLVYWASSPLSAMKQLERSVIISNVALQPVRLSSLACSTTGPCAGHNNQVDEAVFSSRFQVADKGSVSLNPGAVQQSSYTSGPGVNVHQHMQQQQQQQQQARDASPGQPAAVQVPGSHSSSSEHVHTSSTPQQLRARLQGMHAKQQKQKHNQQRHPNSTLSALLEEHQRAHLQQQQQYYQHDGRVSPADGDRLERKLTAILTDSCSSWCDVADVLLAADSTGRLNGMHIAAALATLVRLTAADRAAGSSHHSPSAAGVSRLVQQVATSVVPVTRQQAQQLRVVQQAAAAAMAAGFHSRWHCEEHMEAADLSTAAEVGPDDVADQQGGYSSSTSGMMFEQESNSDEQQQLLDELCLAVAEYWPHMSAASMTSCCWSLASLGQVLPESLLPVVGQALRNMAQQLDCSSGNSSSQGVDIGTLARQLVVMLWSLAKMSVEPQDLECNSKDFLQQQWQQQQHQPGQQQQQHQEEEVLVVQQVVDALAAHLSQLSSQGLVMLWWTLATWNSRPSRGTAAALLDATAAAVVQQSFITRGLAVTVWAVARLRLCPDAAWLAAWLASMRAALPAANSHDCAVSVWALARLGVPPPTEWLAALCWRAAAAARQLGPQELPALLWGLSQLRFRPSLHVAQQLLQRGLVLASRGQLSPQGLALTLWATAGLGLHPKAAWIDGLLAAAGDYLPLFRAVECSGLLVALVRLQHIPHQAWMDLWWQETHCKLAAADGQQLVLLLWGAVQLGQAPPAAWFTEWKRCSIQAMAVGHISAQGYGLIWHALLQLEVTPGRSWLDTYWQASSTPDVLQAVDSLTAEKTLSGLAALAQLEQGGIEPPAHWMTHFIAATQQQLVTANMVNICAMLQAAGHLQLLLPSRWLQTALNRLAALLQAEGVIAAATSSSSSNSRNSGVGISIGASGSSGPPQSSSLAGSGVRGHVSYNLAARLRRRQLAVRLKQALEGLRAQQFLAKAAAAAHRSQGNMLQQDHSAAAAGSYVTDALAVWPWLSEAVLATWPNRLSALQALKGLSGRSNDMDQ